MHGTTEHKIQLIGDFPSALRAGERVVVTEKIAGFGLTVGSGPGGRILKAPQRSTPQAIRLADEYELADLTARYPDYLFHAVAYGPDVRASMPYGQDRQSARLAFCWAFHLPTDRFCDYTEFLAIVGMDAGLPVAPLIKAIPYDLGMERFYAAGKSLIHGAVHGRQGCCIQPVHERRDPQIGRVILQAANPTFMIAADMAVAA